MQPDARPTNRRIKRHKTAEVVNSFPSMGTPWKPDACWTDIPVDVEELTVKVKTAVRSGIAVSAS